MKFRSVNRDQLMLLPPSLEDWLPEGHLARFICNVVSTLSFDSFIGRYGYATDGGAPAYDPKMMVSQLIYAYCTGCFSSRKIEAKTYEDVAYRFICGNAHPDHDTICHFRTYHEQAFIKMFLDVLLICQDAGLVKLGHVAIDGTKILANASGAKTMGHSGLCRAETRLRKKIDGLVKSAQKTDAKEDATYGAGNRGDDVPKKLATTKSQLKAIEQAKGLLEERARLNAERAHAQQKAKLAKREEHEKKTGKKMPGRSPIEKDKEQIYKECLAQVQGNITDPDSALMKDGATKAIVQSYNAQIAVDSEHQIIVGAQVTQEPNDKRQLVPMALSVKANLGKLPEKISADAGYYSHAALTDTRIAGVDLYVPASRIDAEEESELEAAPTTAPETPERKGGFIKYVRPPEPLTPTALLAQSMRAKLSTQAGKEVYNARGAIDESTFGQIKENGRFRRFSMRGISKTNLEWTLVCMSHNILKLWRNGYNPA